MVDRVGDPGQPGDEGGGRVARSDGERTRLAIVDAAVSQLATEGMRGLTHRRVEQRAGVAQGSAKYHFGSLDGLVEAVLAHLVEADLAHVMTLTPQMRAEVAVATGDDAPSMEQVPTSVWVAAATAARAALDRTDLARARFELYLHAADKPDLQVVIRAAREQFVERVAAELDSPDPRTGARMVLAIMDGLLLQQISAPQEDVPDLAALLMVVAAGASAFLPPAGTTDLPGSAPAAPRR